MDTQIIVAIIAGLFGAVVGPLMAQVVIPALKERKFKKGCPMVSKPKRPSATLLQAGIGGVLGVLLGYFLINPIFVSPCPLFAPTRVNISSPTSDVKVPQLVTVQGTACHIPNGKELWLLIVPEGVTGYYPQTGPIEISGDGNWSASAYLGLNDPSDIGRSFVLIAALADQQGSNDMRTYFAQSGPEFTGLEPLPQGVQVITQVRVIRK